MNRLYGMNAYLAGPIDFVEDLGADWRDMMEIYLRSRNVRPLNPLKPIFHGSGTMDVKRPEIARLQKEEKWEELREAVKPIVRWDLRAIDLSSFVVCNYNVDIHQCGTYDEIFTANGDQCKPVLFQMNGQKNRLPKWMYGRFPHQHMFNSWEELKDYINRIDTDPNFEFTNYESKRWMFWFGDHMTP